MTLHECFYVLFILLSAAIALALHNAYVLAAWAGGICLLFGLPFACDICAEARARRRKRRDFARARVYAYRHGGPRRSHRDARERRAPV